MTESRMAVLLWLAFLGTGTLLILVLRLLYKIDLWISMLAVSGPVAIFHLYTIWRASLVKDLRVQERLGKLEEDVTTQQVNLAGFVAETLARDRYSTKLLPMALVVSSPNHLLLCKLQKGEFRGQWQFPAGYADPGNKAEYTEPKLKAEREIRDTLKVEPAKLIYRGVLAKDFEIAYSNPGVNRVVLFEYEIPPLLLSTVLSKNPDHVRSVEFARIEALQLGEPIALFVYEILERYKGVQFSRDFRDQLDSAKKTLIEEIQNKTKESVEHAEVIVKKAERIVEEANGVRSRKDEEGA